MAENDFVNLPILFIRARYSGRSGEGRKRETENSFYLPEVWVPIAQVDG
jgi:hypothetical protein